MVIIKYGQIYGPQTTDKISLHQKQYINMGYCFILHF